MSYRSVVSRSVAEPQALRAAPSGTNHASAGPRGETLRTWQRQRARAADAPRSTRRVDWPLVVSGGQRLPLSQVPPASGDARCILSAVDELSEYRDENTLLRRAVELSRLQLGLERTAIFLSGNELLRGSWGTSLEGRTTDEREIAFLIGSAHREAIARSAAGAGRWLLLDWAPLTAQVGGKTRIVGRGWNALTPIRSARGLLGLLVNDAARSAAPVSELLQERAAVFCALLGNLLELLRAERHSLVSTEPRASETPSETACQTQSAVIAARAVALLQEDAQLGREELAQRIGVSLSRLSRAFKVEMALSVAQYRSRLRLERFLTLVDQGDKNLLAAALDAGFGSYAQFHRVFRSVLGMTPRQYLKER